MCLREREGHKRERDGEGDRGAIEERRDRFRGEIEKRRKGKNAQPDQQTARQPDKQRARKCKRRQVRGKGKEEAGRKGENEKRKRVAKQNDEKEIERIRYS